MLYNNMYTQNLSINMQKASNTFATQKIATAVPETKLITKTITAEGTYKASDDNADGYSSVTVDIE